jgi:hypothetical protein
MYSSALKIAEASLEYEELTFVNSMAYEALSITLYQAPFPHSRAERRK